MFLLTLLFVCLSLVVFAPWMKRGNERRKLIRRGHRGVLTKLIRETEFLLEAPELKVD